MEKRKHTDLCTVPDLSRAPWFLIHFTYKLLHESFSKYTTQEHTRWSKIILKTTVMNIMRSFPTNIDYDSRPDRDLLRESLKYLLSVMMSFPG